MALQGSQASQQQQQQQQQTQTQTQHTELLSDDAFIS
jgi:hypothetical protein